MKGLKLLDILRCQHIHRWTIVNTAKGQSLAEHSFNVAMIARDIAVEAGMDDLNIIKYALDHDLDEIMTGDIPSPAKARMGMNTMDSGGEDFFYKGKSLSKCSKEEVLVVTAADLIDSYLFIKYNQIGRQGQVVFNHTSKKFENWLEFISLTYPVIYGAIENTVAMLEFGKFESEVYDEHE